MTTNVTIPLIEKIMTDLRSALNEALGPDDTPSAAIDEAVAYLGEVIEAVEALQSHVTEVASSIASNLYDLENLDTYDINQPLQKAKETLTNESS